MPETTKTLRELREATTDPETGKAFTGEAIARALGVSVNTYFRWEWNETMPSAMNLIKLERVLPGATHTLVSVKALPKVSSLVPTPEAPTDELTAPTDVDPAAAGAHPAADPRGTDAGVAAPQLQAPTH